METMKALVWKEKGKVELCDRPMPKIVDSRDAIVRVTRASICSSDLHIIHGTVPRAKEGVVLGHEFVGEVVEAGGAVRRFRPGDRVAVNVESFCGECFFCKHGYVNNCVEGGWELGCRIDGGQAEYVRVPTADQSFTRIPEGVSDEDALFVGDVLATGYWAAQIGEIAPASTALVLGAGPTGLCTMMSARLYSPAKIIAVDVSDERLALAKAKGLCDVTLNPKRDDVLCAVRALTEGRGADRVFEVAGAKNTFELAWQAARPNAVVVVVALYAEAQSIPLQLMYGKNLTFKTGGVDGCDCEETLRLIAEGKIDTEPLITHTYPLRRIAEGYELFEKKRDGVIKVAVEC